MIITQINRRNIIDRSECVFNEVLYRGFRKDDIIKEIEEMESIIFLGSYLWLVSIRERVSVRADRYRRRFEVSLQLQARPYLLNHLK